MFDLILTALTIGAGVVVLALIISIIMLRRVVPTNMVHIVQSGKKSTPYGRGKDAGNTYYEFPSWIPKIGISVTKFPESIFQVSLNQYEAYDSNRLPFVVDVTAFFRIDDAETAAQRVSNFEELNEQLMVVLQGSVRRILATNTLEALMQERSVLGQQFTDEVESQIQQWGVVPAKSIEFMDLKDTTKTNVIANIMAKEMSRIDRESRVAVAENQREAETKEIDAKRVVEVQRQDALQQVGIRTAEKDKQVGLSQETTKQAVASANVITTTKQMEIAMVGETKQAEIARSVAVIDAEKKQKVDVINAEAEKSVRIVRASADKETLIVTAEGEKTSTVTKAEGTLEAAKLNAKGIEAEGIANGIAEQAILMAPIQTQIKLAQEIGSNEGYQKYLTTIKQIEVSGEVGKAMAGAISTADLKIIANSGDVQSGMTNLMDVFSTKGGTNVAGMLEALSNSEVGKELISKVVGQGKVAPKVISK